MLQYIVAAVAVFAVWFFFKRISSAADRPVTSPGKPVARPSATAAAAAPGGKRCTILYGTQTATAEGFAKVMAREAQRLKVPTVVSDLEFYQGNMLDTENLVIFVVATYGEGEPPDTMQEFYQFLMDENRRPGEFDGVKYAVFGLGDRQYKLFCQMGVAIDERMEELGAERVYGLGCGDASQNLEEAFDAWRQDLWPVVGEALGMTITNDSDEPVPPELTLKTWDKSEAGAKVFPEAAPMLEPTHKQPVFAKVKGHDELLRNCSDRSTVRVEFDIEGTSLTYQAGDHLGVMPRNPDAVVEDYIRILKVDNADQVISLADATGRNQLPARATIRDALRWYVDLCGPPRKSVLRIFAHYCTDAAQKEEFLAVLKVNSEATDKYHKLQAKVRNVYGFLRKFNSCAVPVGHFFEAMPPLAPRYFSISSDQLKRPTSVVITVAVVANGVCTGMLGAAAVGDKVPLFVRKSNFHLPLRAKARPVIMIGPGTGLAPLVGFCERREKWLAKGNELGPAMLFFGCRHEKEDYIHREYLEQCASSGVLTTLDACFSRDGANKVYVQHRIAARAAEVFELLDKGANLYICGDAKHMAKDVEATLVKDVLQGAGGMSAEQATAKLAELASRDRYHKDVWSA